MPIYLSFGKTYYASNLSPRSLHLAGVFRAGFLRVFSQYPWTHHTLPKRRTQSVLHGKQFSFHGICNGHFVDWLRRASANPADGSLAFAMGRDDRHQPERCDSFGWTESGRHDRRLFSDGIDWLVDPGHCPCRAG